MRQRFFVIAAGWSLDGFEALTERIERLAEWTKANGGEERLEPGERATIKMMIDVQIALGLNP